MSVNIAKQNSIVPCLLYNLLKESISRLRKAPKLVGIVPVSRFKPSNKRYTFMHKGWYLLKPVYISIYKNIFDIFSRTY